MFKDIFIKKENQLMILFAVISIALVFFGFYLLNKNGEDGLKPRKIPNTIEEIEWVKFESKDYSFIAEYPKHFVEKFNENEMGPIFNFYFDLKNSEPPLTNMVEESHISIYPQGIPNSGSGFSFEENTYTNVNGIEFKLNEYKTVTGDIWGVMAVPVETPTNWQPWGFIWFSSIVKDLEVRCFDGSVDKNIDFCNTFEGDTILKAGVVDDDFIKIGFNFLDRISF